MTFIVIVCLIIMAVRIVYLEGYHSKDKTTIARQRRWIINYYYELRRRELPTDFHLWLLELEEPDAENGEIRDQENNDT